MTYGILHPRTMTWQTPATWPTISEAEMHLGKHRDDYALGSVVHGRPLAGIDPREHAQLSELVTEMEALKGSTEIEAVAAFLGSSMDLLGWIMAQGAAHDEH